ncbi:MAG: hypothetical protein ACLTDO_03530 [Bifidobacterium pseudocatenulatum]
MNSVELRHRREDDGPDIAFRTASLLLPSSADRPWDLRDDMVACRRSVDPRAFPSRVAGAGQQEINYRFNSPSTQMTL